MSRHGEVFVLDDGGEVDLDLVRLPTCGIYKCINTLGKGNYGTNPRTLYLP